MQLHYSNGAVFVYDVNDWSLLRKTYKILGQLVGSTNYIPKLPLKLMPEEALYLLDQNVATLVTYDYLPASQSEKKEYEQLKTDILTNQKHIYKENRRKQLEEMKDKIVEGKRKKGDMRPAEEILNEILENSCQVTEDDMVWPILLQPIANKYVTREVSRQVLLRDRTELKYAVCKDLWQQGYYITSGHKFGGDFLAYEGDPVMYHSTYVVHCIESDRSIAPSEIVQYGRLANTVRKKALLASIDTDNQVSYKVLDWAHSRLLL